MSDSFGARLRHERERRQIALRSIAEGTKISIGLLEGLERDDVSRWPSGIFRKSFIRAYAEAVGLNADAIAREFLERYPDPVEVELAAARARAKCEPTEPARIANQPLSIKLTITWTGSLHDTLTTWTEAVHHSIGRLADWKIVRMLSDGRP